jgi:hypothetical protein
MKPLFKLVANMHKGFKGQLPHGTFLVAPGRQINARRVTEQLTLPFDTTLHYAIAHLHPYGESVELRDVMTGTTVVKLHASNYPDRMALERIETFSSVEGVPVYKDHDYELVSVYNNTSFSDQEAMANIGLYLSASGTDGEKGR